MISIILISKFRRVFFQTGGNSWVVVCSVLLAHRKERIVCAIGPLKDNHTIAMPSRSLVWSCVAPVRCVSQIACFVAVLGIVRIVVSSGLRCYSGGCQRAAWP